MEPLLEALVHEDMWIRSGAALALGNIGDQRAVEPLIEALDDKEDWVSGRAAEALGLYDDKRVKKLLEDWRAAQEAAEEARKAGLEAHKAEMRKRGGSSFCARCQAAKDWWSRNVLAGSGLNIVSMEDLSAGAKPHDFGGVCTECRDGFCMDHADDGKCPFCGRQF